MHNTIFGLSVFLTALWCLGRIIGDGYWISALLFYFPSPVLAVLLLLATAFLWSFKQRLLFNLTLVMIAVPVVSVVFFENQWFLANRPKQSGVKLVHWNIYSGKSGLDSIMSVLKTARAQIYAITEPPRQLHKFKSIFSGDFTVASTQHLLLAVKGGIDKKIWLYNKHGLRIWYFKIHTEGKNFTLFLVDIASRIDLARDPFLRELNKLIERYQPNLVVGDFNAPRLSSALQDLPPGYRHAYYAAGSGWSYTWPVPVPIFAIDHILISDRIQVNSYHLQSFAWSDHRMQSMRFDK